MDKVEDKYMFHIGTKGLVLRLRESRLQKATKRRHHLLNEASVPQGFDIKPSI